MAFIPEGYETLDAVRERMGIERLGSALAGGSITAYSLDSWGELKLIRERSGEAETQQTPSQRG
jgi:hypothetical protein